MLIPGQGFRDIYNHFNDRLGALVAGFMNVIVAFWRRRPSSGEASDLRVRRLPIATGSLCCRLRRLPCYARFSLVGHRRRGPGDLFRVAEVVMREWLELCIQLVNQGYACGNVQTDDFLIRDVVEVLDQGTRLLPWAATMTFLPFWIVGTIVSCQ